MALFKFLALSTWTMVARGKGFLSVPWGVVRFSANDYSNAESHCFGVTFVSEYRQLACSTRNSLEKERIALFPDKRIENPTFIKERTYRCDSRRHCGDTEIVILICLDA